LKYLNNDAHPRLSDEAKAAAFEKYLKPWSGLAFRSKHLV